MPRGLSPVALATLALLIVMVVMPQSGEAAVVTDQVLFEQHAVDLTGPSTAAGMAVLVPTWNFDAGGSISGEARIVWPSESAQSTAAAAPVVLIRLIDTDTWDDELEPLFPEYERGQVPTAEQLDSLRRSLRRTDCATPSVRTAVVANTSSSSVVLRGSSSSLFEWRWEFDTALFGTCLVVQLCSNTSLTLDVKATLLNRGGVHSSAEVVPLLNLYATAAILHVLVLIVYVVTLVLHRHGRVPPRVLIAFSVVMSFKTFAAVVMMIRYLELRNSEDQAQRGLESTATFFNFCADIALVVSLMVLSTGYSTVRKSIKRLEKWTILLSAIVYTLFRMASFVCSLLTTLEGTCNGIAASDTFVRFVCIAIAVLFLFRLIEHLTRVLSAPWAVSIVAMRREGDPELETPESFTRFANLSTLVTLTQFKWPFVVYAMIPVGNAVLSNSGSFLVRQQVLVTTIIDEFSILYVFVLVGFHFTMLRPNRSTRASGQHGDPHGEGGSEQEMADVHHLHQD